jgi:hypothetical protein
MAADATFALKPGVWFLRVRFVIVAPDSRRELSPPSGRKSTQPTVQILKASSLRMLKTPGGDREMVEILALVLQHDEQAVLTAVELALEAGAPTKTHILNLLHRLINGKPIDPPAVKPPQALTLTSEPQANVERYDALRKAREARHAS